MLISVAIFILYYLLNTSAYKMAREGEWHIWIGSWMSTLVLAPLGILFTYQSNKDSAIFNLDAYKAFFMSLFGISEKRHVTLKEVVIDDPDYRNNYKVLEEIHRDARLYKKNNKLKRLPSIKTVFFSESDSSLQALNDKLENLIEEMGNSRNKKVIQLLNVFPILSIDGVKSPFNIKWVNILSLVIFPVGIIIYLRAVRFRIGL